MVIAGTGHRPARLGFYSIEAFDNLVKIADRWLEENKPERVISGMAIGWDMALAQATINRNIPLTCAIPFRGQENKWNTTSKNLYHHIISKAENVVYVCEAGYDASKMQIRNEWMVDHCDVLLAMWDGSTGGTFNCIKYAKKRKKPIVNIYERYLETMQ